MEDQLEQILATKKEWRKNKDRRQGDRRIKDGSPQDRNTTADAIRRGRQMEKEALKPWWKRWFSGIFPVIIILFLTVPAHAFTDKQAIKAIIGEAENQGYEGMLAVAGAIRNRGTLKGVYGLHAPRVKNHRYTAQIYSQAAQAWAESEKRDITHGARFWENTTAFGVPYWAKGMTVVLVVKDHKFFK